MSKLRTLNQPAKVISVLKLRVITACLIFAVFCGMLFFAPASYFSVFVALVCLIAAWEWSNLSGVSRSFKRVLYVFIVLLSGLAGWWLHLRSALPVSVLLMFVGLWWILAFLLVRGYPQSISVWGSMYSKFAIGFVVILSTWLSFTTLRYEPQGHLLILSVVLIVAAADIGAYFSGKAFGKRKLAPAISPGKSWEGVIGGLCAAVVVSLIFASFVGANDIWIPALIAVPTAFVSVLGDLFESMLKRHRGIKDSSNLLPGHGGVLDRVDGLVAAVPVFTLGVLISGWQLVKI